MVLLFSFFFLSNLINRNVDIIDIYTLSLQPLR